MAGIELKICMLLFFWTGNRLATLSEVSEEQGCQISHCRVARIWNFGIFLHIETDERAENLYTYVFLDGESTGDIFESLRRTGLPDFALQGCQIMTFWHILAYWNRPKGWKFVYLCFLDGESTGDIFESLRRTGLPDFTLQGCQIMKFRHIETEGGAENLYVYVFWTGNWLGTFSEVFQEQGCQISHCRVVRLWNFGIFWHIKTDHHRHPQPTELILLLEEVEISL